MSKYHVGDAVKIREDLVEGEVYGNQIFIGDSMIKSRGRLAMITEVDDAGYTIDICPQYFWTDEMFDESFKAPAVEVLPFITSKQVLDSFSSAITKSKEVDKLTLINQLTDTLINNLDINTKDMILRYMLLDFFERFIENGNG